MANSWGELGWDIGAWGSQNDSTVSLSSFELISLQGFKLYIGCRFPSIFSNLQNILIINLKFQL